VIDRLKETEGTVIFRDLAWPPIDTDTADG
jgi:hypothetical protein